MSQRSEISAAVKVPDPAGNAPAGRAYPENAGRIAPATDLDNLRHAESLLASENFLLEMLARGTALPEFLEAMCRQVENLEPGALCRIALVNQATRRLEHGAAPRIPVAYSEALHGRCIDNGSGPCGRAAQTCLPVIVADVNTEADPRFQEWCQLTLAHGLQACWSAPIVSAAGHAVGTIALYFQRPATPGAVERSMLERYASMASIAIEHLNNRHQLQRSQALLSDAQRFTHTGSFSWRAGEDEITCSDEIYTIFDFDRSTAPTLDLALQRMHPDDVYIFHEVVKQMQDGCEHLQYEHRLLLANGEVKHVEVSAHAYINGNDPVHEYIGIVRDVTGQKRSADELHKLAAELTHLSRVATLGQLTASIAHEINQPLSGIITNANTCLRLLDAAAPDLPAVRNTATRSIRDANRAADVIARLRAMFGKKAVAFEHLHLNGALEEAIALSRHEAQRSRVLVRTEFSNDLPMVFGDRVQIQQVALNLFLNAFDAMNQDSIHSREMVVRTSRHEDGQVFVSVDDNGCGLDAETRQHMFEAFFTRKSNGMGMGLSISRSIVAAHRGRLWVEEKPAGGLVVHFTLPKNRPDAATNASPLSGSRENGSVPADA